MIWDAETIRRLRDDWAQGYSTAEIGRRLGMSKNAIVGKAHRLDLDERPSPIRRDASSNPTIPSVRRPTFDLPPLASLSQPVFVPTIPNEDEIARLLSAGVPVRKVVEVTDSTLYYVRRVLKRVELTPKQRLPKWQPGGLKDGLSSVDRTEATYGDASIVADRRPPNWWLRKEMTAAPKEEVKRVSKVPCCWPIGEPRAKDFRYCEGVSEPGFPYCDEHCRVGYSTYRRREAA